MKVSEMLAARFKQAEMIKERPKREDFRFTLNKLSDEGLASRLQSLIGDIRAQGRKVAEHLDFNELKQYRNMITDFINEVITNSHEFSRENFLDRRGRHHVYGIVRLVNQELDALAQDLLNSQKTSLELLEKIDEIHGLLLDMVV
jgi:uncharacterized protein YaaR (DUF327 family)